MNHHEPRMFPFQGAPCWGSKGLVPRSLRGRGLRRNSRAGPLSTRFVHRWRQSLGNGVVLGVPPAGDALGISDDRRLFGLHPTEAIMKRLEPADFYLFTCKSKLPSGQDPALTQVSGIKLEASF